MAASLAAELPTIFFEGPPGPSTTNDRQASHDLYCDQLYIWRCRFGLFKLILLRFQPTFGRFANVGSGLLAGLALRPTAGQRRDVGHEASLLARFKNDLKCHDWILHPSIVKVPDYANRPRWRPAPRLRRGPNCRPSMGGPGGGCRALAQRPPRRRGRYPIG